MVVGSNYAKGVTLAAHTESHSQPLFFKAHLEIKKKEKYFAPNLKMVVLVDS